MGTRRKSTLLAQGKERRFDDARWPWRVRLYPPPPGGTTYQVYFKAPTRDGEPWRLHGAYRSLGLLDHDLNVAEINRFPLPHA